MPSESKAACCIAPDSEWATGWPMRTTRLVMLAPFRGRRRNRDRRWRPSRAARSMSVRWRRGRRSRTSWPADGRRGCPSRRRAGRPPPRIVMSSPSTSIRAPSALSPAAIPAIRSDSLWRSSPAPRMTVVPVGERGGEAQDRDLVDRRRDVGRPEVDRRAASTSGRRGRRAARRRRRRRPLGPGRAAGPADSSMSAPIERRMSMIARRVGLTPTSRSDELGIGMDRARDEPERRRRDVARDPLLHCTHRRASFDRPGHPAVRHVRPLDRHAPSPQHPLRVVARGDRLADRRPPVRPQPRQQDRRLHLRARHRRREVDRPERGTADHGQGREGVVSAGDGAPRPSSAAAR